MYHAASPTAFVTAGLCLLIHGATAAQDLAVAAASDLQSVLPIVADRFQRETGSGVSLTFGSSGNFYAQLLNGAPFDLFFSADIEYPERLASRGLAEPGSLSEYAAGSIVLWTRSDSGLDVGIGLRALLDPRIRRVAIANPDHAPYGRAAIAALEHERLYANTRSKLVFGENVSQAAQFAQSGSAEAGILALSLALSPALRQVGRFYKIPASFHAPLRQGAVILRASRNKEVARRFLAFLGRPDIRQVLQDHGLAVSSRR